MLYMQTAFTDEVDDKEEAVAAIAAQLDFQKLQKNRVGLVSCNYEFVDEGIVAALHKKLQFDIVGMTTCAVGVKGGNSKYGLILTVLSSDDISFSTAITEELETGTYKKEMETAYSRAKANLAGEPVFIFTFMPFNTFISGFDLHSAFNKITGGIPTFGSFTCNSTLSQDNCLSILNDTCIGTGQVMVLMSGNFEPEYITISIPNSESIERHYSITKSEGCHLYEINGTPVIKFLEDLNIDVKSATATVPFLITKPGHSAAITLAIFARLEDGALLFGGEVPVGSTIQVADLNPEGVIEASTLGSKKIFSSGKRNGALIFPCATRFLALHPDQNAELENVSQLFGEEGTIPYAMAYSGGEICPINDASGILQNEYHNFTFSAMIF